MSNTLYTNDNLFILHGLNSESVDLIYLDPPFNSKRIYSAPVGSKAAGTSFKDIWTWADVNEEYLNTLAEHFPALTAFIASAGVAHSKAMAAYLTYMAQRIVEMHRVLKDTGSIYLHCDPAASHYLKTLLDIIFGKNNFRNEIVWCYTGPGSPNMRQFNRKHDIIFWYSKGDTWAFNKDEVRLPYKGGKVHSGGFTEKDGSRLNPDKYSKGKVPETWWTDITPVGRLAKEIVGYPTQKPLALLNRIIKASSNEGDVVMDPFCGCATTCVAAQQLGRKWIGIDISEKAADLLVERLSDDAKLFSDFVNVRTIPQRTDLQIVEPTKAVKERLYKEQKGLCNGCGKEFDIWNLEIDHIIPKAKGGGNYYENYQLLCSNCNRIKGERPMEFLRLKIETRNSMLKEKIIFGE